MYVMDFALYTSLCNPVQRVLRVQEDFLNTAGVLEKNKNCQNNPKKTLLFHGELFIVIDKGACFENSNYV